MSTAYCLVEKGVVKTQPRTLPEDFNGILNFHKHPAPEEHGWLPVVIVSPPEYDPRTQKLVVNYTIGDGFVTQSFAVKGMNQGEIRKAFPVPRVITATQAMIALDAIGKLVMLEELVVTKPKRYQIWFTRAASWPRKSRNVTYLLGEIGMTDAQIDDFFVAAAKEED